MLEVVGNILTNCWLVLAQMAPYLLLGFAIAGAMSVLVSAEWVGRHLGGRGLWPTLKATVLGVPLPLCSCGVIPVSAGLRRQGASRGATSAFLLSTPQTGVDSILATYALLGPVFAVIRPVVALVSGVVGGLVIDFAGWKDDIADAKPQALNDAQCASDDCCTPIHQEVAATAWDRFRGAVKYGFVTLPRDIAVHLLIGVAIAGALTVLIEPNIAARWLGGGLLSLVAMMVIGLPLYVCATGSIPLALAFMYMGASPGAALVFLIAGPETNAATLAVTWKLLGKRSAVLYLLIAAATALGAGYAVDLLWTPGQLALPDITHPHGVESVTWLGHLGAAALLAMMGGSFLLTRKTTTGSDRAMSEGDRARTVLDVQGMTCSHCAAAVARALQQVAGVAAVEVDLDAHRAVVRGGAAEPGAMVGAVEQLGYRAAVRHEG